MGWAKGVTAEEFVVLHLTLKGWRIEARNYRRKGLEIDIIASRGERLICVEVKARNSENIPHPANLMRHQKLGKLESGMLMWLADEAPEETRNVEFWLCSVLLPTSRAQAEWIRIEY